MKLLGTLLLALIGCGSSSSGKAASATPASTQAPASAQDQAASQVCSARDAIQTQVRKQQVQDATTAFGTQLKDIVRQTAAGLSKTDAQTQATNAATSLKAAVKKSLQPIQC
jgi:uncharacterized Zn finger protein